MHLKPYHKLSKKDPSLELNVNPKREHVNHRSLGKEEKCITTKSTFSSTSINTPYYRPLETIIQTMCMAGGKVQASSFGVRGKVHEPATIHQGEEDGTLDIRAIIKPGNTKEKIAFFASHQCSSNRTGTIKVRSTWDINGRSAKRRKRSLDFKAKNPVEKAKGANMKSHQFEPFACGIDHCSVHFVDGANAIFSDGSLSVIEMVAFLEQRASALLSDRTKKCANTCTAAKYTVQPKGVLSVSEHLTTIGPNELSFEKGTFDNSELENETICVLDMVAKLESECLKRQSERNAGSLSRNNSFQRHVGRLLLATGTHSDGSESETENVSSETRDCKAEMGSFMHRAHSSENRLSGDESAVPLLPEVNYFHMPGLELGKGKSMTTGSCNIEVNAELVKETVLVCSEVVEITPRFTSVNVDTSKEVETCCETISDQAAKVVNALVPYSVTEKVHAQEHSYSFRFCEDPLPGTLFFQHCDDQSSRDLAYLSGASKDYLQGMNKKTASKACEHKHTIVTLNTVSISDVESTSSTIDISLKGQVFHDFWKVRYRIQQLLEPQQYMLFLPHHIMVNIFGFLPTKSLAALKCTCHYFKFIIEYYDIRPVDSLWVCDLRYRDDPCKQCKKQYVKGDVSLCWWHPKPYCQALPYGPGYWMCCHRPHKDSAGCKVGLHDNRWVPACHSFNRQMYKKRKEFDRGDW